MPFRREHRLHHFLLRTDEGHVDRVGWNPDSCVCNSRSVLERRMQPLVFVRRSGHQQISDAEIDEDRDDDDLPEMSRRGEMTERATNGGTGLMIGLLFMHRARLVYGTETEIVVIRLRQFDQRRTAF